MIEYTVARLDDLKGILELQRANLRPSLTQEEIRSQGFVTVVHRPEDLKKMNEIEQHVIAKDGDKVVAYLIAMTEDAKEDIPVLVPMFELFSKISFNGKPVSDYHYIVVGQVCVAKGYRGQGVLDQCYEMYRKRFSCKYDFAITDIVTTNLRSLNAHLRIGFQEIHRFATTDGTEWSIVLWDWK